jgi:hypothetical protein
VRNTLHVGGGRARRNHLQHAIDLHRIGIDDHAAEFASAAKRQRRLAAGRWSRYQHRSFSGRLRHAFSGLSMPVLCLTANPNVPELDASLIAAIQHETQGEINWLNHGVACEIIDPKAEDAVAAGARTDRKARRRRQPRAA